MNELEKALFKGVFDYAHIAAATILDVAKTDVRARAVASRAADAALDEYRKQSGDTPCPIPEDK